MAETKLQKDKIDRFYKGDFSEDDESYVNEIFNNESQEEKLKSYLSTQFSELLTEDNQFNISLDHLLYRLHYEINTKFFSNRQVRMNGIVMWSLRLAGIVLLPIMVLIGIYMFGNKPNQESTWVEIHAPAWTRAQFTLPDGTTGWLNSNSSIKYNGNFLSDRNVALNGEAFFDVLKKTDSPFTVNANDVILKVLGTRFNVASYENENNIEVVLEEGKLIFNNKEMDISYTMTPNEMVTYNKALGEYTTDVVQPSKYIAWTEGKLVFRNDPLDNIARRLERWYNIEVSIRGNFNNDIGLRATFIDKELEEVLELLRQTIPIRYQIEYGEVLEDDIYSTKKVIIYPEN